MRFDDSAALAREPEFLLHEELRDLAPYHSVLIALAQGKSSPAQLAKSTGIDVRGLNYHLNTLVRWKTSMTWMREVDAERRPTCSSQSSALIREGMAMYIENVGFNRHAH